MTDHPPTEPVEQPYQHRPVMLDEIVAALSPVPAGVLVDATVGGGGHAEALLEHRRDLSVVGIDRDPEAIAATRDRLGRFGDRFIGVHARFDALADVLRALPVPVEVASGVLFDLGVSCPRRSLTAAGAGSPTASTDPSTCAWTRPRR
jgi:16S rRNA (cytosine1402-N4)-methyltransferase